MAIKDWKAGMSYVRFNGGHGSITVYERKTDFLEYCVRYGRTHQYIGVILCEVWVCDDCGIDFVDDGKDYQLAAHALMHAAEKEAGWY